jgi:hypothetical protein
LNRRSWNWTQTSTESLQLYLSALNNLKWLKNYQGPWAHLNYRPIKLCRSIPFTSHWSNVTLFSGNGWTFLVPPCWIAKKNEVACQGGEMDWQTACLLQKWWCLVSFIENNSIALNIEVLKIIIQTVWHTETPSSFSLFCYY